MLFADITAGEYLTAAERLLRASVTGAHPLPVGVLMLVETWLERYRGASEYPWVLRQFMHARRIAETAALSRVAPRRQNRMS